MFLSPVRAATPQTAVAVATAAAAAAAHIVIARSLLRPLVILGWLCLLLFVNDDVFEFPDTGTPPDR